MICKYNKKEKKYKSFFELYELSIDKSGVVENISGFLKLYKIFHIIF